MGDLVLAVKLTIGIVANVPKPLSSGAYQIRRCRSAFDNSPESRFLAFRSSGVPLFTSLASAVRDLFRGGDAFSEELAWVGPVFVAGDRGIYNRCACGRVAVDSIFRWLVQVDSCRMLLCFVDGRLGEFFLDLSK